MLGQAVNWDYQWGQVVGRAWADEDFKRRLLSDPAGVLAEYDLTATTGQALKVLENPERLPEDTASVKHLILPARPSAEDLSEEDLFSGDGGAIAYCGHDWCRCRCKCHDEWCRCGCYAPPRPEEN